MKCLKCNSVTVHLMESDRDCNEVFATEFKPYANYYLKCGDCGNCDKKQFATEVNPRVITFADVYDANEKRRLDPEINKVYSFEYILSSLELRDSPFLLLSINDNEAVIQLSHIKFKDLIESNEKFAKSSWRYIRETREWIPIFKFADTEISWCDLVDYEPRVDCHVEENEYWVTPKGFPREQYKSVY